MDRKLRLAFVVSALALTLASFPAHAGTSDLRLGGSGGFLSGLWSRLVAIFTPYEALNTLDEQDGENPENREGGTQGRGYIDPNGINLADNRG